MAVMRINRGGAEQSRPRPEQLAQAEYGTHAETVPRVLWLLLVIAPLLVGCTVLVPVAGAAAFACGAAAGAAVIAWPWFRLYRAMRENERVYPEERRRPWWQRWPWGSPPIPRPKTRVDRFFDGLGFLSGGTLGLFVLAWLSGLL